MTRSEALAKWEKESQPNSGVKRGMDDDRNLTLLVKRARSGSKWIATVDGDAVQTTETRAESDDEDMFGER
eukprot:535402-Pyramimonas_sp.AAC.1